MTGSSTRQMHLNLFMRMYGHHPSAWRRPSTERAEAFDPDYFVSLARVCERGLFDAVFLADTQMPMWGRADISMGSVFEPMSLISYMAAKTDRIGFIGTVSSTLNDPANAARLVASANLISGGRVGMNLVTSQSDPEALLHGMDALPDPESRYARAKEFAEVLFALWDSYPRDAVVMDKETGTFFDESAFRTVDHDGDFYKVKGTLSVPESAQGRPVLVQAGASPAGRDLAARYAEVIYGIGSTLDDAQEYYADIKRRTLGHGRAADSIAVLPGVVTVVGDTEAEAKDKKAYLDSLKELSKQLDTLGTYIGMDVSRLKPDDTMPALPSIEEFAGPKGRYVMMQTLSRGADGRLVTVGEMLSRISAGGGHFTTVGTPSQIADELVTWFQGGAADGFNVNASTMPEGIEDFVDLVVPELQERGVFRTEYTGSTLRGHLTQDGAA
ncbi:LLM class flavin-dependent oxidoreductase [Demequina capsici]|uniref:LLM class flavin-dependent oxidoreductase n=1 Tax=Demequina capsici TaxID=3075620 RepID=A0AA96JCX3_9MICO|nr:MULTISPECIES: LLM class flavin-dependent oxidoreductase [unclassified Demequina]WNM24074.1 LLM class flavin-dependent oxidoreductase [Demequina sp. OYTSA14]WNM26901.1 LLM class flavin-dependent oxidoreductase [Demequina sp. PMTSA13]